MGWSVGGPRGEGVGVELRWGVSTSTESSSVEKLDFVLKTTFSCCSAASDGEAYIGDEYLVPGSTPLHIAVIIGNLSIIHAILQVGQWLQGGATARRQCAGPGRPTAGETSCWGYAEYQWCRQGGVGRRRAWQLCSVQEGSTPVQQSRQFAG